MPLALLNGVKKLLMQHHSPDSTGAELRAAQEHISAFAAKDGITAELLCDGVTLNTNNL